MKTLKVAVLSLSVLIALTAFSGTAKAGTYGPYHPYVYGHSGYWDEHHAYHHWERYHDHDGYWIRRADGVRIFIQI